MSLKQIKMIVELMLYYLAKSINSTNFGICLCHAGISLLQ